MDRRTASVALAASICLGLSLTLGSALLHRAPLDPLGPAVARGQQPAATDTPMLPQPPPQITPTSVYTLTVHPEWGQAGLTLAAHPERFLRELAHAPDGAGIAFTVNKAFEDGDFGLYLAQTDAAGRPTGTVLPLRDAPAGRAFTALAASAAAGAYAALAVDREDASSNDVYLVSADGAMARNLTGGRFSVQDFLWAPDGAQLALLTTGGALYVLAVDDGSARLLADDLQSPAGGAAARLAWSPDSSRLAVADLADKTPRLEVIDLAGGARLPLAIGAADDLPAPVFSADGSQLFYLAQPQSAGTGSGAGAGAGADSHLYRIAPLAGATPLDLVALPGSGAAGGPDGRPLLYPVNDSLVFAMGGALYRLGTDGGGFLRLTAPATDVTGQPSLTVLGDGSAAAAFVSYAPRPDDGSAGWTGPSAELRIGTAALP